MPTARTKDPLAARWSTADSADLYQLAAWSQGYLDVAPDGQLCISAGTGAGAPLAQIVEHLREKGIRAPVLLRFPDILADRLERLRSAFAQAIADNGYRGEYRALYPVKVNQQRLVLEEIYRCGAVHGFGLEVGSKPELLAVMALTCGDDERPIVCNGFKDSAYVEAAVLAAKLGRNIIPVVENFAELELILRHAERYGVAPAIGVRVQLDSRGSSRWSESTGAKSKFGLSATQLLQAVDVLREHDMLASLQLVHCHAGSQLQDIRYIKEAIGELAHVYAELARLGANVRYLDVGGGLGVDYDGSRTNYASSMNYTLEEYAAEVVYRIGSICDDRDLPHPTILSESGRAVAAYHSVLVFEVLGSKGRGRAPVPEALDDDPEVPQPIRDLFEAHAAITPRRLLDCYHDALEARRQAVDLFRLGYLSLENRGLAERLFWSICRRIQQICERLDRVPEELESLQAMLSETYFCNLSIFQSLPDVWAIGQLFPILPIHRLNEPPSRRAVLADLTCDSDGHIGRFTDVREVKRALEVHELRPGEPYYLAAFLVGAYQETLGDLHNLFGDTHVAHVRLSPDAGWQIEEVVEGDSAAAVLGYVRYDVPALLPKLQSDSNRAVAAGRLTPEEASALQRFYESSLAGYTYLSRD